MSKSEIEILTTSFLKVLSGQKKLSKSQKINSRRFYIYTKIYNRIFYQSQIL